MVFKCVWSPFSALINHIKINSRKNKFSFKPSEIITRPIEEFHFKAKFTFKTQNSVGKGSSIDTKPIGFIVNCNKNECNRDQ